MRVPAKKVPGTLPQKDPRNLLGARKAGRHVPLWTFTAFFSAPDSEASK